MLSFQLEYPITRSYRWPLFTPLALLGSLLVLVLLTIVNVAGTGYETVSVLSEDYNMTQSFWWSPFNPRRDEPICEPRLIRVGDTFSTSNNAFTYLTDQISLDMVDIESRTHSGKSTSGAPYFGQPLSTECFHVGGLPSLGVVVNTWAQTIEGSVTLSCHGTRGDGMYFELHHTTELFSNDVYRLIEEQNTTAAFTLQATVSSLAFDIFIALSGDESASVKLVMARAHPYCSNLGSWDGMLKMSGTDEEITECMAKRVELGAATQDVLYNNGSLDFSTMANLKSDVLSPALNQSIDNYFQALYAATLADFGIWNKNSIFVSKDMFNQTISSANDVASIISQGSGVAKFISGRSNRTLSNAETLRQMVYPDFQLESGVNVIPVPESLQRDATISTLYSCRVRQWKDGLSLVISVLVADFSMFAVFWGLFMLVASTFAKRQGSTMANACAAYGAGEHSYALHPTKDESEELGHQRDN